MRDVRVELRRMRHFDNRDHGHPPRHAASAKPPSRNELEVHPQPAIEKVEVWIIVCALLLHSLSQIHRFHKCLCAVLILCQEKKDNFIRVVSAPKKVILGKACFSALWQMSVVPALPF